MFRLKKKHWYRVQAKVTTIEDYGAFVTVNAGGLVATGMIHKTKMSWGIVTNPENFVKVGATHAYCVPLLLRTAVVITDFS